MKKIINRWKVYFSTRFQNLRGDIIEWYLWNFGEFKNFKNRYD